MRLANWKMAMLYKVKHPINSPSVLSEAGTVNPLPRPSLAVCKLVFLSGWQGNSEAVIPLVLVHWVGQRVNELVVVVGGVQTLPRAMLTEALLSHSPTHTHTGLTNRPTHMETRNAVGGLESLMSGAEHNGMAGFTNPVLSLTSVAFLPNTGG